jgi:hypothetical protein
VLPVLARLLSLADRVAGGGQATVSAGLLVAVTRLSGEGERGGVAGAGLGRLAGSPGANRAGRHA